MKPALQPSGCGVGITSPSKGHGGLAGRVYRAFLTVYYRRKIQSEMTSFFRTAEAMGLDPMKNQLPEFLLQKLQRTHEIMHTLRGINFPLTPEQRQP